LTVPSFPVNLAPPVPVAPVQSHTNTTNSSDRVSLSSQSMNPPPSNTHSTTSNNSSSASSYVFKPPPSHISGKAAISTMGMNRSISLSLMHYLSLILISNILSFSIILYLC
jgi:hypothetical protein